MKKEDLRVGMKVRHLNDEIECIEKILFLGNDVYFCRGTFKMKKEL